MAIQLTAQNRVSQSRMNLYESKLKNMKQMIVIAFVAMKKTIALQGGSLDKHFNIDVALL